MLSLYNTMTRRVGEFRPLNGNTVGLYTCGLTVYNYAHIGNLRTYVFEDILKRTLLAAGYQVRHVMNITDVGHLTSDADVGEDKMEEGSAREGKTAWQIAEFYQQCFVHDLERLHIRMPDIWCKATGHIAEQIEMVATLERKGYTYIIPGDGVYMDTSKVSDYGKLARLDIEGLQAGARIEMVEGKRNYTDFALWKFSPAGAKRQMEWPSPWGTGFPGWHIECSAMAIKYLGERIDIHCGGIDHVPIHHTNEIAQAEAALGHEWVNWWVHGEFLTFPREGSEEAVKMSKSSGEFLTLDRLIQRGYEAAEYRYFLLGAHYRQQLAFSWTALDAAQNAYRRLKRIVLDLRGQYKQGDEPLSEHVQALYQAAFDDLNMPQALAAMWMALKDTTAAPGRLYATLLAMDSILGLGVAEMREEKLQLDEAAIDDLIAQRNAARKSKDFAKADEIRKTLADKGIILEDKPGQTLWRRA